MQTLPKPPKLSSKDGGGALSSKNGAIGAAVVAAVIAGLLIVMFLTQYRNNINEDGVPTPVVVAQQLIDKGASGDTAGAQGLFKSVEVPRDQLKTGAVTDPAVLRGKIAVEQIVPGQQITAADFTAPGNGLVTKLAADQRAITIAIDNSHGLLANIRAGDRVDILSGFQQETSGGGGSRPVLRMLMQDVLVLAAPAAATGDGPGGNPGAAGEVTLRVDTSAAPKVAFAADNGTLRLLLRPQNGDKLDRSALVSMASLLVDSKPVKVPRKRTP